MMQKNTFVYVLLRTLPGISAQLCFVSLLVVVVAIQTVDLLYLGEISADQERGNVGSLSEID